MLFEMTIDELLEGIKAELAIKLFGPDMAVLEEKAGEIEGAIATVPGATDVQKDQVTGTPQLRIRIDRGAIARYGINVADVQEIVRTAVGGELAGQIFEGILASEEEHVDFLETQFDMIARMGLENYVQLNSKPAGEGEAG